MVTIPAITALSLILTGQTELREMLKLQVNEAISHRVDIRSAHLLRVILFS